jgi:hypothetical protein
MQRSVTMEKLSNLLVQQKCAEIMQNVHLNNVRVHLIRICLISVLKIMYFPG